MGLLHRVYKSLSKSKREEIEKIRGDRKNQSFNFFKKNYFLKFTSNREMNTKTVIFILGKMLTKMKDILHS